MRETGCVQQNAPAVVALRVGRRRSVTSMQSPQKLLEETDWSGLKHAYGPADAAPFELLHLLGEDAELCGNAIAFLDGAVLHQETIYSVTAPAALFVAAILDDARTLFVCSTALPWDDRQRPLRAPLLEWLGEVAAAAAWRELDPDPDAEMLPDITVSVVVSVCDHGKDVTSTLCGWPETST